jgi:hypothetical protein
MAAMKFMIKRSLMAMAILSMLIDVYKSNPNLFLIIITQQL